MLRRLANRANEWHRSFDALLNDEQSLLQPLASMPEGPAAPDVCRAADLILEASIKSKTTGCISLWTSPRLGMADAEAGCPGGCLLFSASRTEVCSLLLDGTMSSR